MANEIPDLKEAAKKLYGRFLFDQAIPPKIKEVVENIREAAFQLMGDVTTENGVTSPVAEHDKPVIVRTQCPTCGTSVLTSVGDEPEPPVHVHDWRISPTSMFDKPFAVCAAPGCGEKRIISRTPSMWPKWEGPVDEET